MLRNWLTVALRGLRRNRGYVLLNVAGLSVGLACAILIGQFVRHELTYDGFHEGADRIYRVVQDVSWAGGMTWDWTTPVLAPRLAEEFTGVDEVARFHQVSALVSREGDEPIRIQEDKFAFVDASFFELFAFPLASGDAARALQQSHTVVLTETAARRYFGDASPIGETLRLENRLDLTVTGVLRDLPSNTHFDFDFAASIETLGARYDGPWEQSWWWPQVQTYVRMAAAAPEPPGVEALGEFVARHREPHFAEAIIPRLQPINRIHLHSDPGAGAIRYVYIFALVGVFVLLLACVNYMNLATAHSAQRAREVGVRKAVGAGRRQLAAQFLSESVLVTALATGSGLLLARLALPWFNELTGARLAIDFGSPVLWGSLLLLTALVSLVSGGYPAVFLSRFSPQAVLRAGHAGAASGRGLRRGLVVVQFAVTIALIAGSGVIYHQVGYLQSASLGFNAERVVALTLRDGRERFEVLKERLQQQAGVVSVSGSSWFPGDGMGAIYATTIGGQEIDNDPHVIHVDADFFAALQIDAVSGRLLEDDRSADLEGAFLLNETAVQMYELPDPVGQRLRLYAGEGGQVVYEREGEIVGIVNDFHLTHLRVPMQPAAITLADSPEQLQHVLVRLAPGDPRPAIAAIEAGWRDVYPELPLEATFVRDRLAAVYEQEVRFGQAIGVLSALAMIIACLGLFGLAAFAAERRTREIGVRKVLGASVASVIALLSRDFLLLVAAAFAVGAPLAYWGMNRWLETFAYRVDLNPVTFVAAGAIALAIALLTVSGQAIRAAKADPVKSLRSD